MKLRYRLSTWLMSAAILLALSRTALGAIVYVDSHSHGPVFDGRSWETAFQTIQQGIDAAVPGDEVHVACEYYPERITLKDNVAIYGGFVPVFRWKPETSVGPGCVQGTGLQIVHIERLTITGGGVAVDAVTTTIRNCIITGCYGSRGGGVRVTGGHLEFIDNEVTDNHASESGGGLYFDTYTSEISDNRFLRNWAALDGGGLRYEHWEGYPGTGPADLTPIEHRITRNVFRDNWAGESGYGGGLSYFANWHGWFPDISNPRESVFDDNEVTGNHAYTGGGMYVFSHRFGPVRIEGNSISANTAGNYGGGVSSSSTLEQVLADNRICRNSAGFQGGGLWHERGRGIVENNVIAENTAPWGAGIYGGTSMDYSSNTIVGNHGDGLFASGDIAQIDLVNNIICSNTVGIRGYSSYRNQMVPRCCNVWGNTDGDLVGPVIPGPGHISLNPLLDSDGYPLPDSPCIDAGINDGAPTTDFEGSPRIVDADGDGIAVADIGAYEYRPIQVQTDILPGDDANRINRRTSRLIAVAILSTRTFDARWVDQRSVTFGPGRARLAHRSAHLQDVDMDGRVDLLFHFGCSAARLTPGLTSAVISGRLINNGERFIGTDAIQVVDR